VKHQQKIISLDDLDIRYPTVRLGMAGSDPRHLAPNYSCAMPVPRTDGGLEGRSLIFTIGDGTQIQVAAVALRRIVVGRTLGAFGAPHRRVAIETPWHPRFTNVYATAWHEPALKRRHTLRRSAEI